MASLEFQTNLTMQGFVPFAATIMIELWHHPRNNRFFVKVGW
jgi:hypothetical protein